MGRLFGNDGIRGIAVKELTCELAMQVGRALGSLLRERTKGRPVVLVGKDTRLSSDVLEGALNAGICASGCDVRTLGVIPMPAVAYLTKSTTAMAGVMITASHNTMEFNGIMLFGADGAKLPAEDEAALESRILDHPELLRITAGTSVGRILPLPDGVELYLSHIVSLVPDRLDGLRLAVDCANGCTCTTAAALFTRLGAQVTLVNAAPDGFNINQDCGSTHIDRLMNYVAQGGFDAGLAFDGDGDRCLAVDETGELVDGDKLIAIVAKDYKDSGKLSRDAVVVTVMSNLGFTSFAKEAGIRRITANIGDRYVLEKMIDGGYNLGGEQSGHIFFLDDATTGDGQLSGARVLEIMHRTGKRLSELASIMRRFPQVMINVKIPEYMRENWKNDEEICRVIDQCEEQLGDAGRILVRESGGAPFIRVMIEGKDFDQINAIAMQISDKIRERIAEA